MRSEGTSETATATAATNAATAFPTTFGAVTTEATPTRTNRPSPPPTTPRAPSLPRGTACAPCCGGSDCIAVRRGDGKLPARCTDEGALCKECTSRLPACVPFPCDVSLEADLRWKLRISYVADGGVDPLWKTTPAATMCIGVSGTMPTCFPISTLADHGGSCLYRLSVTTDDVTSGRVFASFTAAGRSPVSIRLAHATLGPGGLCVGWLSSGQKSWVGTVGWFLDPPSDPDAVCEREERARPQ